MYCVCVCVLTFRFVYSAQDCLLPVLDNTSCWLSSSSLCIRPADHGFNYFEFFSQQEFSQLPFFILPFPFIYPSIDVSLSFNVAERNELCAG